MSSGLNGVGLNDTLARLLGWTAHRTGRNQTVWRREPNAALPHRKLLRWYNVMPPAYDRTSELMVELMEEHGIAVFLSGDSPENRERLWCAVWPRENGGVYDTTLGYIDANDHDEAMHPGATPQAAVAACALHHLWVVPLEAAR